MPHVSNLWPSLLENKPVHLLQLLQNEIQFRRVIFLFVPDDFLSCPEGFEREAGSKLI